MKPQTLGLIISTYNWPKALEFSLNSVKRQSVMPDEIVIADDGSTDDTRVLIERIASEFSCPVRHVWHADDGFRKTVIMNKAVAAATSDYLIQIDGDIVLHPNFVEDHLSFARKGYFIRGGRAILSEAHTANILSDNSMRVSIVTKELRNRWNAVRVPILSRILSHRSGVVWRVKGCNMSYWREDFIRINGYDNNITGWGHEDIEFAARLFNSGLKMRKVKMAAIAFHLFHTINSRAKEVSNFKLFERVFRSKITHCENGYQQVK